MRWKSLLQYGWLIGGLFSASIAEALTPAQLQQRLANGEPLTLIDIRPATHYQKKHIVGAINVPAPVLKEKQFPRLGRVVIYDAGLGHEDAELAVNEINRKPGIQAEVLLGGFATWETVQGRCIQRSGLQAEDPPFITYDQLLKAKMGDLILVDLRSTPAVAPSKQAEHSPAPPLTDLRKLFPQARIVQSPFLISHAQPQAARNDRVPPLLVLIDRGQDSSRALETAHAVRAGGNKRVVILAGGETILARHGQPGRQRMGINAFDGKP